MPVSSFTPAPYAMLLCLAGVLPWLCPASLHAAPGPGAFLCETARRSAGGERPNVVPGVALADGLSATTANVGAANRLCSPASLDGSTPGDVATHLVRQTARSDGRHPRVLGVRVDDVLGTHHFDVARPRLLLAPTAVDEAAPVPALDPASHGVDRYRCYPARASRGEAFVSPAPLAVTLASGEVRNFEVVRPRQVCAPAAVGAAEAKSPRWHLACYDVRPAPGGPRAATARGLHVDGGFGAATLDTRHARELCVPASAVVACNGARELCDRRYDEVAYATTHNAMSNAEDGFLGPNQQFSVARQLEDGVRGLMLDTHYADDGTASLCHAYCALGQRPLVAGLGEIRDFLERHPHEVVTIIFESYVSANDTRAAFAAAGLLDLVHAQPVADPWPTLADLIAADHRLVVFTDSGGGSHPWYHHVWNYAFETHYSFASPAALSCAPNRGNPANRLFILNHFLTQLFGSRALAEQINHDPLFIDRARSCMAANGHLPNFVTVDFHDIGDVFAVVDALNGL